MALYLPQHNALFLLCPQTASDRVASVLRSIPDLVVTPVGVKHAHKDLVGTLRFERKPYTFAVVRNPLDWYSSYWRGRRRNEARSTFWEPTALWHPTWDIDPGLMDEDFGQFIDNVTARPGYLHDLFRLYTGRGTSDEIDYIAKTENLLDDVAAVLDTVGVSYRRSDLSPLEDASKQRRTYPPELKDKVAEAERATFAEYDYGRSLAPRVDDIPGWFRPVDRDLFRGLLSWQVANEPPGDLVELGCYLGKSTVVMGEALQPGETFTVCDLFGQEPTDVANATENSYSYRTLDREQFERNYLRFHPQLPVILAMPTSEILDHVKPGTARFVHVDASHLYEHVVTDIASARRMLRPGGIVIFDDYRSGHTPGVAAAVWGAMVTEGLIPIALTGKKWYGTWDDPAPTQNVIREWARTTGYRVGVQMIADHEVLRVTAGKAGVEGPA